MGIIFSAHIETAFRFMAAGGWNLTHTWLSDAIVAKNWPLIQELLELLLMCPVDVERLKTNYCPKLIKGLSKESSNDSKYHILGIKITEAFVHFNLQHALNNRNA